MASGLGTPWDASALHSNSTGFLPKSSCGGPSDAADAASKGDIAHHPFSVVFGHDWENVQNIALIVVESLCALVLIYCVFSVRRLVWTHKGEIDKLRTNSLRGAITSTILAILIAIAFVVVNQVYVCAIKSFYVATYAIFGLAFRGAEIVVAAVVARTIIEQLRVVDYNESTTSKLLTAFTSWLYLTVAAAVASYVLYLLWLVKIYATTHVPYEAAHFGEIAAHLDVAFRGGYLALTLGFLGALLISMQWGTIATTKDRRILLMLITVPLGLRALEQVVVICLVTFNVAIATKGAVEIRLADAIVYNITTATLFLALIRLGQRELPAKEEHGSPSYVQSDEEQHQTFPISPVDDDSTYPPKEKPVVVTTTYEPSDPNWR